MDSNNTDLLLTRPFYLEEWTKMLQSAYGNELHADVSLVCQGKTLMVHRSVVASLSPVLRNLLNEDYASETVILFEGFEWKALVLLVNFFYHGMVKGSADDLITVSQFAKELQVEGLINANCMRQSLKLQLLEAKQAVQIQLDTLEEDDVQIQLDTLEEGDIQSELDSPSMLTQQEVSETHDVKVEANGTQSELSSLLPEEEEDLCIVYETTTGTSWPKKGISNKKNPCLPPALIPIEKLADTEPVQLSVDPQLCQAPLPHDLMLQPSTKVACKRPASDIAPLKHPKKSNRVKEANADPKLLESCSPATDNLPRPPTTQRKIPCRVCGVYFDTPLELRIHREASHANVLECGVCKKILSSKKSLKIHLRNHIKRLDLNISNAAELTK